MSLLQMGFYGTVLIVVIVAVRAALINVLPKRTFVVLWCVALVRLLVPFHISSAYSVYSLIGYGAEPILGLPEGGQSADALNAFRSGLSVGGSATEGISETGDLESQTGTSGGGAAASQAAMSDAGTFAPQGTQSGDGASAADAEALTPQAKGSNGGILTNQTEPSGDRNAAALVHASVAQLLHAAHGVDRRIWILLWGVGTVLCAAFFTISYVRCRVEFGMSLPVSNDFISQWMQRRAKHQVQHQVQRQVQHQAGHRGAHQVEHRGLHQVLHRTGSRVRRSVSVRVSDRIDTPLTYGVFKSVILLPKKTEWEDTAQLEYILWHEYMHIYYFDSALKLAAVAALCLHWFQPFVWVMYFLLNRDIELACDESVVRRCGVKDRAFYANMLIGMEAKRSGVMPLCNNFSKNAIEGRIRAVMKIKKFSLGAAIFAAGLVVGVTTAFATSAAGSTEHSTDGYENTARGLTNAAQEQKDKKQTGGADFTKEEYDKLRALQFDGYRKMSVSDFQEKVWAMTDTAEYRELLERFSQDEALYEKRDTDEMAFFLYYVLDPLTAEQWRTRSFSGGTSAGAANLQDNGRSDMAVLEYVMTLTILDADRLRVGDYVDLRQGVADAMSELLSGYTAKELADEELMRGEIDSVAEALTAEGSKDEMRVEMEYFYQPIDAFHANDGYVVDDGYVDAEYERERQREWESLLKPYMPFGLTCTYDAQNDECKMYFEGREVRGIMDVEQGVWITEHSGIAESVYDKDAIDVYTVYKDGRLAGLRAATEAEQEEWDLRRQKTTDDYYSHSEEVREFAPGTREDYRSILSLKKPDYQRMSLADFNAALLDWGNWNPDSFDRIMCDGTWDDFRIDLSEEERDFIKLTVGLSSNENAMEVRGRYMGMPAEDVTLGDDLIRTPEGDESAYVWCHLFYQFSYHISDKEKVTVAERDRLVGGMTDSIRDFWEQTDIEDILEMDKGDIIEKLNGLAEKHSTRNITITVGTGGQIGFECMDERELMRERD